MDALEHGNRFARDLEPVDIEAYGAKRSRYAIDDVPSGHVAGIAASRKKNLDVPGRERQDRDLRAVEGPADDREEHGFTAIEDLRPQVVLPGGERGQLFGLAARRPYAQKSGRPGRSENNAVIESPARTARACALSGWQLANGHGRPPKDRDFFQDTPREVRDPVSVR